MKMPLIGLALTAPWLIAPLRHAVEANMAAHMLLQFPLLLAAGWCVGKSAPTGLLRRWRCFDRGGLTAIVAVSCVSAFWMVPVALDLALLDARIAFMKLISWWIAGAMLGDAWARLHGGLKLFFLGNIGWMLATAGLLYQEAEVRLCANYLLDEQRWTGMALVASAVLIGGVAIASWRMDPRPISKPIG